MSVLASQLAIRGSVRRCMRAVSDVSPSRIDEKGSSLAMIRSELGPTVRRQRFNHDPAVQLVRFRFTQSF